MATIQLYSVTQGSVADYDVTIDQNGELVATHDDETLKFPAGLSKAELTKLVSQHNKANEGTVARDPKEVEAEAENRQKSQDLVDNL